MNDRTHIINNLKTVRRGLKKSDNALKKEEHIWFNEIIWIEDTIRFLEEGEK